MSTEINIKKRITILEESAILTKDVNSIDFVGAGVVSSAIGDDVTVTIGGGVGAITYYLNETVTQSPYKEFSSIVTGAAEQLVPLTVAGGVTSVIAEYQTPVGVPGSTQIAAGLWSLYLHFNAAVAGQNWIIRPTVYKRDLGGIETLLFTSDPVIVTNMPTVTTMYLSDGVFPATTLLTTDRLVVRLSMENTTGVSQTVTFRTEGSQHYSVATTTLNPTYNPSAVLNVTGTAPIVSSGGTTPAISIPLATGSVDGYLSSSNWLIFDSKQDAITLTTSGSSGASTFITNTLNVPTYTLSGLGGVPSSRSITINGTTYDLSADRTWNVGTVTSVAALTLGTTGTDLSSSITTGTTTPVITLNVPTASAANRGALSSTDWSAFNSKIGGSGTINYLSKWSSTSGITDSNISDDGAGNTTITATGDLRIFLKVPAGGVANVIAFLKNNINSFIIGVDSSNNYIINSYNSSTGAFVGNALTITANTLNVTLASLAGSGTRMVTVDAAGLLSTQDAITLTTTGTSGAATLVGSTLNIPQYAGGLTYFTEAQSTAAPNTTVNVDSLTAIASTTNADFAIRPKGSGSVLASIPDGTATGGNKRGVNAVDLQTSRNANTNVASGNYSVISGGLGNTASGLSAFVGSGYNNTANGYRASIVGGDGNTAQGTYSITAGRYNVTNSDGDVAFGVSNTTNGLGYCMAVGQANTITAGYESTAFGGYNSLTGYYHFAAGDGHVLTNGFGSTAFGKMGKDAGFSRFIYSRSGYVKGDNQTSKVILSARTTTATPKVLTIDFLAELTTTQITLQPNNVYRIKGSITGKQSGSTNVGVWDIDCVIVQGVNAASTVIAGTPTVSLVVNTGSFGNPTLTANTTLGCLTVTVIGVAATNIQWTCAIDTCETIYA